jgi:predicted ABC-type transport system involved in lysophospholipase L1 biosynthesis ATPase subunit
MLLELERVWRTYDAPGGRLPVLRDVSLALDRRRSLAVLGPSGSGKSTLLNLMGALDVPDAGQVRISGRDVAGFTEVARAELRNSTIGFVFQAHHLLPQLTVWENVLVPALVRGVTGEIEDRARRLLSRVGLSARLDHPPGMLSFGERQRVAVARALVNGPKLVLADEPTGALDRATAEDVADLLIELVHAEGAALVAVTHSEAFAGRMERALLLSDGRLAERRGGE